MSGAAVELRGITVRYGDTLANRDVSLLAAAGEVHAIVGENGAGKSTLMRALYGLAPLAAGEVWIGGERIARPSPAEAIRRGAGMVHQHFMLVEPLTVAENVVLGVEPRPRALPRWLRWLPLFDRRAAREQVAALAARHGLAVDPSRRVAELSVGEQQRVEILKLLARGARILILDEPTAVLAPPEVRELLRVLGALRDGGATILMVTHKLDEVAAIADRVTVLRRGEVVARIDGRDRIDVAAIARAMVGREPAAPPPRDRPAPGAVRLELRDLTVLRDGRRALDGARLALRGGEILGIAGIEGNGQAELCGAIAGRLRPARGALLLDGQDVTRSAAGARRRRGLAYVPEDRQRLGLIAELPVADNLLLGRESHYRTGLGTIDRARLAADAAALIERFDIRPATPATPVRALSGGNQQKVVLARELAQAPRVLLAAQPTRGVDIGAIERIHRELSELRRAGGAVLLVSAELDELLALADRIAVLHRGRLVATLDRAAATAEHLGALMTGATAAPNANEAA